MQNETAWQLKAMYMAMYKVTTQCKVLIHNFLHHWFHEAHPSVIHNQMNTI